MNRTAARILVISPNWIGDAIMAQPLLQLLKQPHNSGMANCSWGNGGVWRVL